MRLTTAMTAATPMTTPMSVSTLRSLCAQRLEVAIATASEKFIVDGLAMGERRDRIGPHPNIRRGGCRNNMAGEATGRSGLAQVDEMGRGKRKRRRGLLSAAGAAPKTQG